MNTSEQQESRQMNVPLMPSLTRNQWVAPAIQLAAMHLLYIQADSNTWPTANSHEKRNHRTQASRVGRCSRLRASGAGDSQAGCNQGTSAEAAGIEAQGVAA